MFSMMGRSSAKGLGASQTPSAPPTVAETVPTPEEATAEFSDDEVTILSAVFSLQSKRVVHLLEPGRNTWDAVRMVQSDQRMDLTTMQLLLQSGHSRIPVCAPGDRNNVRGILLVKEHIALDPDDAVRISSLKLRHPVVMHPDVTTFDALNVFQAGQSHMALITPHGDDLIRAWRANAPVPPHVRIVGLCTIEDVIEELIGEEILDDTDQALTPREQKVAQCDMWKTRGIWTYDPSDEAPTTGRAGWAAQTSPAVPETEAAKAASFSAADPLLGDEGVQVASC